jgi:hypothetical protein
VKSRTVAAALVIASAIVFAACSGSATDTTTTTQQVPTDLPALEFGTGVLPATVPSDFPMPQPSVITTTMVDSARDLTEIAFNVGGDVDDVELFFVAGLPPLGYETGVTPDGRGGVIIDFEGNGIEGNVSLVAAGQGLTTGMIVFVHAPAGA